jgi:hypothetical protein
MVGIIYTPIVFLPEFICGCALSRISVLPESFLEKTSFSICLKLKKNFPLNWSYDINDFLFQPLFVNKGDFAGFFLLTS